jgi:hypothetical protein
MIRLLDIQPVPFDGIGSLKKVFFFFKKFEGRATHHS